MDVTPIFTTEWIDVHDENTMYSPSVLERKLTTWEANVCPWWLDYPVGIIPKQELELHESKYFNTSKSCFLLSLVFLLVDIILFLIQGILCYMNLV